MLGFVTGLTAEARLPARHFELVGVGGGTARGAAQAAELLVSRGAVALVSFGLAGGLDPGLRPGDLLVPESVIGGEARFYCDPSLVEKFGGATVPLMVDVGILVDTVETKHNLFASTGAAAIDLESAAVARVAEDHGLRFAVLRAVADPAGESLPPAALTALDAQGRIASGRVLASICRHPLQVPALARLALNAGKARRTLSRALEDYRLKVSATGT